jgi:hypothetical protein
MKDSDKIIEKGKKMGRKRSFVKFCPNCGSTRTDIDATLSEPWDRCLQCGFRSRSFPEKERN